MKIFRQRQVLLTSLVFIAIICFVAIQTYYSKRFVDLFYCIFMIGSFIKYIKIRLQIEEAGGVEQFDALSKLENDYKFCVRR